MPPRKSHKAELTDLRESARAIRTEAEGSKVLGDIKTLQDGGLINEQVAAKFAQIVGGRLDRLRAKKAERPATSGAASGEIDDDSFEALLRRMLKLIETEEYAVGHRELCDALDRWSNKKTLNARAAGRLLHLIERFGVDEAVSEHWRQIFLTHANTREDVMAPLLRFEARRINAASASNVSLLSLGIQCLPWLLPNRWGLRRAEHLIALDAPFNLAAHDLSTIVKLLGNDFEGYTDPANFAFVPSASGENLPHNKLYRRAVFNHHRFPYWTDNNFQRLTETLKIKVNNVRKALTADNLVLLISNVPSELDAETEIALKQLMAIVERASGRPPLLIATTSRNFTKPPHVIEVAPRIHVMSRPYPNREYDWVRDMNTAQGLIFELSYVADLCKILSGYGLWPA